MNFKIGVDGGGTKTECILIDARGAVVARHLAPGCNPSIVGADQARLVLTDALCGLLQTGLGTPNAGDAVARTQLYMAGNRIFWRDFAAGLTGFGEVVVGDDSLPVLELATNGQPGLVLHAGTGSFVAARAPDGSIHYAGGLGWRFGDAGSGYEIGRLAIARGLLELQGWAPATRLGPTLRAHAHLEPHADPGAISRFFYQHPEANRHIAALAPAIVRLASEGDPTAQQLVLDTTGELLSLATRVATRLFAETPLDTLAAGLSGPILTQPFVVTALAARSPLPLRAIEDAPIEGVRRLLQR